MRTYIIGLLVILFAGTLSAQTLNQATKQFERGEYEKAKPVFRKLVKSSPNNAGYNFHYGACCYETDEKEEALPYLEKSAKKKYINAYRYLGKLYADMYRYEEAIENYETHIDWLIQKNRDTEIAEEELEAIRQKARLLKGVEKVAVIDSLVVSKAQFLSAYHISKESGSISMSDEVAGTIYTNEMGNKIIYADTTNTGDMQLYTRIKLLDGWGEAEAVTTLNELGNVNYPFLMGDGTTLYFASDNENSIGGYDIFITRYDSEDNTYLKPSNIGMPFNSNANDYMMVIDEFNNLGWFASDRYQPEDSVCIYVFEPNEVKQTYNYENEDKEMIANAATLRSIRSTWTDMEQVNAAQQRLTDVLRNNTTEDKKRDFVFVINDSHTYHYWSDFKSSEAKKAYMQLQQKEKQLQGMQASLAEWREQYAKGKTGVGSSILNMEKKIPSLAEEIDELFIKVRNLEIQKMK